MPTQQAAPSSENATLSDAEVQRMALSAWVDGEADDTAWEAAWFEGADSGAVHENWHCYQLIGDVLRAGPDSTAWSGSADAVAPSGAVAFARRVTQAAQQQGPLTQVNLPAHQPISPPESTPGSAREAANDGVFRWKMVSGFASFTAVLGIAWGVAGGVGQGGGAVLAVSPNAPQTVQVADTAAVLVATPQGQVLRDVRLQELMQTHRQMGGASALQAPAGFLRASTLDAPQR